MVSRTPLNLVFVVLLILLPRVVFAGNAEIELQLDSREIELGRVFLGQLHYRGKSGDKPANLQPWENNFFIERSNFSVTRQKGLIVSSEDIRLYPRRSGKVVINAIAHGGVIMEPIDVKVRPLRRDGIDGAPVLQPVVRTIQVGSPIDIIVEVPLLHPANKIVVAPWEMAGMKIMALPQQSIEHDGHKTIKLHWRLFAEKKGVYRIELPAIQQRGNGKWRFHLPLQEVEVFPLPSYLPPTLPVGQISMRSEIVRVNGIPHWRISVNGTGLLSDEIHGLRAELSNMTGVAENRIVVIAAANRQIALQQQTWQLPVPQWSGGIGRGPRITQRYFDPQTGEVEVLVHDLPAVWRFPGWMRIPLLLAAVLLLLPLARSLIHLAKTIRRQQIFRRQIKTAECPDTLRRLLINHYDLLTLEQWAQRHGRLEAAVIARDLNALCFSNCRKNQLDKIRQQLLELENILSVVFQAVAAKGSRNSRGVASGNRIGA